MDEKRNRIDSKIIWDIFEGDLVQVKRYTIDGEEYYEKGIVVAESQTASDTTFRIWDWGREEQVEMGRNRRIVRRYV